MLLSEHPHRLPHLTLAEGRPPVMHPGEPGIPAAAWVEEYRAEVRAVVAEHGAVLVRGLPPQQPDEVRQSARVLVGGELLPEREGFAIRTDHGGGLYSSAAWPAQSPMCMHHELSYADRVPATLLFACLRAPADAGATALADGQQVLRALPAEVTERFVEQGWLLQRCYLDTVGMPWPVAFGTSDRAEVEAYCRANRIDVSWIDGGLRTRQRRAAVRTHPVTGQAVWFNQIAFLSRWTMDAEVRDYLTMALGPEGLPFDTRYGDGGEITPETVDTINKVYDAHTVREPWQAGDLMIVDNLRTAHSREAFSGDRQVLVAMGDPAEPEPGSGSSRSSGAIR